MTGLARLYREAGRAGTFMRQLDRALEPARRLATAGDAQILLSADDRLALLIGGPDPFAALASVLERVGARPAADEHDREQVRRLRAELGSLEQHSGRAGAAIGAGARRTAGAGGGWRSPRQVGLAGSGPPARGIVADPAAVARRARGSRTQPGGPGGPGGRVSAAQSGPALAAYARPAALRSGQSPDIAAEVDDQPKMGAARANTPRLIRPDGPALAASDPFADPVRAAEILTERLRVSRTLQAFRTVVRISGSVQLERASAEVSTATADAQVNPVLSGAPASAEPPRGLPRVRPDTIPATGEATSAGRGPTPRASVPIFEPGARGLRRLAALATESLDEPKPDVDGGHMVPAVVHLEDELERILRAEALAQGIDPDGGVR